VGWFLAIGLVLGGVILYASGLISLDSFMGLWQWAFVVVVKGALFAMIPGGLLLGAYIALRG
jgi:hypothetical protein